MVIRGTVLTPFRRFLITYVLLICTAFAFISFSPVREVVDINGLYTRGIVYIVAKLSNLLGIYADYSGSLIRLSGVTLDVRFGCNGLEAVMIYSIAVIAFPSRWREKLIGIVVGFIVIQVANLLRIVLLMWTVVKCRKLFDYVHIYVAQSIMIAVVFVLFCGYLHLSMKFRK